MEAADRREITTVFVDRDGTINEKAPEGDYVKSWPEFRFLPRAPEALGLLTERRRRVVIVTNQRGIARGLMSEDDLADIHRIMLAELKTHGAVVDAVYHCPHDVGACTCRKPGIGMLEQARRENPMIDFARSALIGDSLSDVETARRARALPILVDQRARRESAEDAQVIVTASLWDAATWLTAGEA